MAFKLTIEVPDNKLTKILKRLGDQKVQVENLDVGTEWATVPKAKKPRKNGNSLLTMTGKTPQKNSQLGKALDIFEKLEKRVGIGSVTKKAFRDELVKKKQPKGLANRCVTEKVLAYL